MRKVGAVYRSKVIGLLGERLSFERASVRLYDAALERLQARGGPFEAVLAHLRRVREEEKSHEEWLEENLRLLGGAPDKVASPRRDLALGDPDPAQLFHLLLAEKISNLGGWEVLVELAERAQDGEARREFRQRLDEEQEHFRFLSRTAAIFTRSDLLDETVTTLEDASA